MNYRMFLIPYLLLGYVLFSAAPTNAAPLFDDDVVTSCKPTFEVPNQKFFPTPENLGRTNNLRRKTGIAVVAKGEPIYVMGRVVDEECVPVSDAIVEVWHANTFGRYSHPDDQSDNLKDENFVGSGFTRTDNLGQFTFLSIFPGSADETTAPRIHFRVTHPDFKEIQTEMYFPEQEKNYTDAELSKDKIRLDSLTATVKFEQREGAYRVERIDGDMVYHFTISLKGKNKFRRY